MTFSNGHDGHFVYSMETTIGTRVTPAIALPFLQESIRDQGSQPLENQGIIKGRRIAHGAQRTKSDIRGQVRLPLIADGLGGLLKAAFGAVATTGSGPYAHEFTRGLIGDGDTISAQIGWEDNEGTDFRKDIVGGMVDAVSLEVAANQNPTIQLDLAGRSLVTDGHAAITPSYGTLSYFEFSDATVNIDGAGTICFDTFSLNVANNLYQSPGICPANPRATVYEDGGKSVITGTIAKDFDGWGRHTKFTAGTEATIAVTLTAAASAILLIELNVRFAGETAQVSGQERIKESIPFMAISATSDADACTVTLTNSDSTP